MRLTLKLTAHNLYFVVKLPLPPLHIRKRLAVRTILVVVILVGFLGGLSLFKKDSQDTKGASRELTLDTESGKNKNSKNQTQESKTLGIKSQITSGQSQNGILGSLSQSSSGSGQTQSNAASKIALGVVIDNFFNSGGVISFQQQLGIKVSTVSIYRPFGGSERNFDPNSVGYVKNNGSKLMITWEPWDLGSANYLPRINSGEQDSYIRSFAASVKQYGGQVTLRFGHEMNGDWYPWGSQPGEYIAAYRRVHDIFVNSGVTNVNWNWCPNQTWDGNNITNFYPGDSYVDSIGIDGFNFGLDRSYGGWQSFSTIFGPSYQTLSKYNKTIIVAETASSENGGNKASWVTAMFSDLQNKYPKIKEVIWFNTKKEANWPINSSSASLQAFQNYFKN